MLLAMAGEAYGTGDLSLMTYTLNLYGYLLLCGLHDGTCCQFADLENMISDLNIVLSLALDQKQPRIQDVPMMLLPSGTRWGG